MRVLLVEDEPKLAFAVKTLLEAAHCCDVVGIASDGPAAIQLSSDLQPEVAIVDVRLAEHDGIVCAGEIVRVSPSTRIIIYSGDDEALTRARDAGFPAALLKGAIADELIELVERPGAAA